MIKYFKRTVGNEVVGLGYYNELDPMDFLVQMFKDVDYVQEMCEDEEFKELGIKYQFEGFKPNIDVIPIALT